MSEEDDIKNELDKKDDQNNQGDENKNEKDADNDGDSVDSGDSNGDDNVDQLSIVDNFLNGDMDKVKDELHTRIVDIVSKEI